MKAEQLQLLLVSLNTIQPLADQITRDFYHHLFETQPTMSGLFKGDMHRQGSMLITTLSLAVNGLSNVEDIQSAIWSLGNRHHSYGVKPEYFPPFRESFIWSLEYHMGDKFTPDLKSAWIEAFDTLSEVMMAKIDEQRANAE